MHAARAVSSPLPLHHLTLRRRRRRRCDRSSYKRSLVSTQQEIRDSLMHYLTGPNKITETTPVTVSDLRGVEPLRDG